MTFPTFLEKAVFRDSRRRGNDGRVNRRVKLVFRGKLYFASCDRFYRSQLWSNCADFCRINGVNFTHYLSKKAITGRFLQPSIWVFGCGLVMASSKARVSFPVERFL
jgi:hypothetical protein